MVLFFKHVFKKYHHSDAACEAETAWHDTFFFFISYTEKNFNDSNTNGSFTVADSNSFLCPLEILPIAQENEYLEMF